MTIESFVEKKSPASTEKKESREEELTRTLQRVQADFDNFRKRTQAEQQIFYLRGKAAALKDLLAFADTLDAGVSSTNGDAKKGIENLRTQFHKILAENGIAPIHVVGKAFDPFTSECLQQGNDPTQPEDFVLAEFQKGYYFHEDVIRTAKVKVNKKETTNLENQNQDGGNNHE